MEYSLVASIDPEWLQGPFDTLTGFLDRVGIQTSYSNTFGMLCCPYRAVRTQSEAAYKQRMMGEGLVYWAHQRLRVKLSYCGSYLTSGLLAAHHEAQYVVGLISQWEIPPPWDNHRRIGFTFQ